MGRRWGDAVLAGLRCLVIIACLGVVAVGALLLATMQDAESRGIAALDRVQIEQTMKDTLRALFNEVVGSQLRILVAIGAGCFTFLSGLLTFLSSKFERLRISGYVLVPLEAFSMAIMGLAFAAALTLFLRLAPHCARLESTPPELASLVMVCPLSKGYTGGTGGASLVLAITSLSAFISACHRAHAKSSCSFEPTASKLGMGDDYRVPKLPTRISKMPTLYDPEKPLPGTTERLPVGDEEKGFATAGEEMGRRDSGLDDAELGYHAISEPPVTQNLEVVQQTRPAHRPWSEMPPIR